MFVEGDVEIKVQDRAAWALDDHELKLWLQRGFRDLSCYRIAQFRRVGSAGLAATVALKLDVLPPAARADLTARAAEPAALRQFIEQTFTGRGQLVARGTPVLRTS